MSSHHDTRPIIALTIGDPTGIGPEVVIRALTFSDIREICRPVVVGDGGVIEATIRGVQADLRVRPIAKVSEARFADNEVELIDLANLSLGDLVPGKVAAMGGRAAYEYVATAINMAMANDVDAIVTAPLNKEALNLAGYLYPGHTEILAALTHTPRVVMMLTCDLITVSLVTIHTSLRTAIDQVRHDNVLFTIELTHEALRRLGFAEPRLAIAGLNPHAGEAGLFGNEEELEILPAVRAAQSKGINAQGPFPPDTIFMRALNGQFDAVVAMTHDHGLAPLKAVCFESAINVTLGLPIIRTSPDHGTAFGRAWQWRADPTSESAAIRLAARMAGHDPRPKPRARSEAFTSVLDGEASDHG